MPRKLPHLLIFNPDQWRGDAVGHLGNPAAVTPTLDRCASEDFVSFRWAFCQNPVCTPSRCSFMTGWYPHVRGHRTMYHMLHAERGEPCLLKILKDNGYHIWWGGKNDLVPAQQGFDACCDVKYVDHQPREPGTHSMHDRRGDPAGDCYYSFYLGKLDKTVRQDVYYDGDWSNVLGAIDLIRRYDGDKPLCIYLPLSYPHPPYGVEEPYYSMIDRSKLPARIPAPADWDEAGKPSLLKALYRLQNCGTWTEPRWTELRATYYGMCARVDEQFRQVLQALKDRALYDDTAVFFFSDHGDFTGDYGLVEKTQNTFEDCLTRVPLMVKPPKDRTGAPRVSEALTELIDFTATVYDLTGIDPGYDHFGRSLMPLISGETSDADHRDAVFCEGGRLRSERQAMERESNPQLDPAGWYYPRLLAQRSDGPEHTKATMCRTRRYKYIHRLYETDELYDLQRDPGEQLNRAADPKMSEVLSTMKTRLLRWYQETADVVPYQIDQR